MVDPITCLAAAIFFEARSEPDEGQRAVAEVVINRVESEYYPDDVCQVVFQHKQFSFTHDGLSDNIYKHNTHYDKLAAKKAVEIATAYVSGDYTPMGLTSTHYHADNFFPFWTKIFPCDGKIGKHIFYTEER